MRLLRQNIWKFGHQFRKPEFGTNLQSIQTHSWFHIKEHKTDLFNIRNLQTINDAIDSDGYYTKRFKLYLKDWQKTVINKWLNAYIHMYNHTIKYFRTCRFKKEKNSFYIRDLKNILKDKKNEVYNWSKLELHNRYVYINRHLLDYAINDALKRLQSCLTNFKNKNIKHFRLRYLGINKSSKIIKIENLAFRESGFYTSILKKVKCNIKNFNYAENHITTSILQYKKISDEYYLLIKYKQDIEKNKSKNMISLDPGISIPFTGYSNTKITEIGTNANKYIENRLKKIDRINEKFSSQKASRLTRNLYTRIKNKITDFHWKTINYLLTNNKTVLIGDLSTKRTGELNGNKMTKRIGNLLNFYKFRERLKYKCYSIRSKCAVINESYTSKICCRCGFLKYNLGANKIYNCDICSQVIGRDINGAINILMKALL